MVVKHELKPPNALISQLSVLSFIITVKKMSVVSDFFQLRFFVNMMSTVINHLTPIFSKLHYDNLMTVLTFYIYVSTNICLLDCN